MNDTIRQLTEEAKQSGAVTVGVRSNTNQAEAPSMAANTSSLVDTSSASDLVGPR
jgi:hypothetical protein